MTQPLRSTLLLAATAALLSACGPPPSDVEGRYGDAGMALRASRDTGSSSRAEVATPVARSQAEEGNATAVMGGPPAAERNPLAGLPGAASASAVPPSPVEDARITARVRATLAADRELHVQAARIDVDTHDGVVTLSGPVPSLALKARAGEVARLVRNVQAVNDQLTLVAG